MWMNVNNIKARQEAFYNYFIKRDEGDCSSDEDHVFDENEYWSRKETSDWINTNFLTQY